MENLSQNSAKNKRKKNFLLFAFIVLLLITNIFLLVKVMENDKKVNQQEKVIVSTRIEKDVLMDQLKTEKSHFELLKTENSGLRKKLSEKDREINNKIAEIEKLINSGDEAQLRKAKTELAKLRKLNDQFISQIALLKKQNKDLSSENAVLNENLSSEKSRVEQLSIENKQLAQKVALGSQLKLSSLKILAFKYKNSGKEVQVEKASKTEKLKICFTVLENPITEKGLKTVYIRIINPTGVTLSNISETISYKGQTLPVSAKQDFQYDNKDTELCFLWSKPASLIKGDYALELYMEGNQVGFGRFHLN